MFEGHFGRQLILLFVFGGAIITIVVGGCIYLGRWLERRKKVK